MSTLQAFRNILHRELLFFPVLLGTVGVVFILDIMLGSLSIPFSEIVWILLGYPSENQAWEQIIYQIRLPRACTAVLAGSALAVGGLQMQTLFRNPLAGPSILGISAGASMGVATVMLTSGSVIGGYALGGLSFLGSWLIIFASVSGSSLVMVLILIIARKVQDNVVLLIVGLMLGMLTSSLVALWQFFSEPEKIRDYLFWTFGSLSGVQLTHLRVLGTVWAVGIFSSFLISKSLNLLLLGENYARSMGLNLQKTRLQIIFLTGILTGSITAFAGPIGFVGIAVPHVSRALLRTSNHKILIPACSLVGALLMLLCDIIAKVPGSHTVLPINSITALIGAPVVIAFIIRKRNLRADF